MPAQAACSELSARDWRRLVTAALTGRSTVSRVPSLLPRPGPRAALEWMESPSETRSQLPALSVSPGRPMPGALLPARPPSAALDPVSGPAGATGSPPHFAAVLAWKLAGRRDRGFPARPWPASHA